MWRLLVVLLLLASCEQSYGAQLWQKEHFVANMQIENDRCDRSLHEWDPDIVCSGLIKDKPVVFVCTERGCVFRCGK